MRHDPERAAAAYLAGELGPRQRERFEAHVLACDDCWREVTAGRQGRALAESLREVAPQHLRERIRATIAAAPAGRRRRIRLGTRMPALMGVVAALVAVAVAGGLLALRAPAPAQPVAITAAVASYRAGVAAWTPTGRARRPARRRPPLPGRRRAPAGAAGCRSALPAGSGRAARLLGCHLDGPGGRGGAVLRRPTRALTAGRR